MAVHKRTYRGYSGPLTGARTRFLVLFRYAFRNLMRSRLATVYLVACLLVAVVFGAIIYVSHSALLLELFRVSPREADQLVGGSFFYRFIQVELGLAFVLTAFAGPGLISPDLANQALPLYFCRPFSRAEYVLGKFSVLAALISVITWLPGLVLFALQSDLAGWDWTVSHLWIARAIFVSSLLILLVFSALALALSAWFKRKTVAGAALLGVFFVGAGLGHAIDAAPLGYSWGALIDVGGLIDRVVSSFFRVESGGNAGAISPVAAAAALLAICAFCLYLIERRIRAREIVRQ
jgi:ABC-2 type transport system permease protein